MLVDWLPWSHTFGANHNLGQVLAFGGTLHIDDGKPAPGSFDTHGRGRCATSARPSTTTSPPATRCSLRGSRPTATSPRRSSRACASCSTPRAALPEALWHRLRAVADDVADHEVPLTASWGTTETAPAATTAHFSSAPCGCIGVPLPGRHAQARPRGRRSWRSASPGPTSRPATTATRSATAAAFDEEGFYRTGDAVRFVDTDDAEPGPDVRRPPRRGLQAHVRARG